MPLMHDKNSAPAARAARGLPLMGAALALGVAAMAVPHVSRAQVSTITVTGTTPGLTQGTITGGAGGLGSIGGLSGGSTTRGFVSVFYVPTASGTFTFGQTSAPFDSVMFLATGVYNPASPAAGVTVLSDDSDGLGIPGVTMGSCGGVAGLCPKFSAALTSGTTYSVVVTSFGASTSIALPLGFYTDAPGAFAAAAAAPAPVAFLVVRDWSAPMGLALAAGLPAAGAVATPEQAAVFGPLLGLSASQMLENQRQMAPMIYADTLSAQRGAYDAASASVAGELSARRGGVGEGGGQSVTTAQGVTFWMQGGGTMQRTLNGPANQPGSTVHGGGASVGADTLVLPGLRLGVAVGVAHQVVRAGNGGQQSGEVGHLTGYGSYSVATPYGMGFVDAQASVLAAQGRATRPLAFHGATARGDTAGLGAGGQVKAGVRMDVAGWQVEPSVGFSALRLHQGGLNEYGAGAVGANVNRGELTSVKSLVGVRVDRGVAVGEGLRLVGSVTAAWAHEMGDDRARVSGRISGLAGSGFTLSNAGGGRDALVTSAQLVLETQSPLKLFVAYANTASERTLGQAVTAGLRYSW